MTRRYTSEIGIIIGPQQDIPAPDVNTNAQIMAWMMDTYSMNVGGTATGVVTGKPMHLGGSLGRVKATGRGVFVTGREAARRLGLDLRGARVAVQGFGNVGSVGGGAVRRGRREDRRGAGPHRHHRQRQRARPARRCCRWRAPSGVGGFKGGDAIANESFWDVACDILIPAALEGQVTAERAQKHQGQARARRRQRPDRAGGRRHPGRARRAGRARRDLQRRRRDGQLLRVGAGLLVSFFWDEDEINQRLDKHHGRTRSSTSGTRPTSTGSRCAPRPSRWPASAS